jgi:F420-dependent oxidoreductase-like protein
VRFSLWALRQQSAWQTVQLAQHAEQTGWDGFWVADHFMPLDGDLDRPRLEAWSLVAALAVAVPRIRIGTLVAGNTYRHPAVLAKAAVTVDELSGGRLALGLGAGWQQNEHRAYGIPFPPVAERLGRLEDACTVIRLLLAGGRSDFAGRYYSLADAPCQPRPAGPLPLVVGGAGEKVTLRIAAKLADEWNCWACPELARKARVLGAHCADLGRDPATIGRSVQAMIFMSDDPAELAGMRDRVTRPERSITGTRAQVLDQLAGYAELGFGEFIVPDLTFGPPGQREDKLAEFIAAVAPLRA